MTAPCALAFAVVLVLATSACSGNQAMLNPQGPPARSIAAFTWVLFGVCTVVYVAVLAALWWALARRRRDTDEHAATTQRMTRTVVAATVLTAATLVVLTISSEVAGRGLTGGREPGAITVEVIGHQWWWDFLYRDVTPSDVVNSPNELHIPVGLPVVLEFSSRDVIHSFWVPNLQGKRDLVPGQVTRMWIQADAAGTYRGQCAEFCGHQHANMAFIVVAEPMEQFQSWLQAQRRPAPEPASEEARRGRDVFLRSTCATCHTIRGTDAGSRFGPDLTHVASRQTIAAGTLPNTRGHLAGWIADSQSIKPGNRMPPNPLNASDLQAVLSYVRSLR
jgi:cytochrome c oxidase subunit II